jgi:thymidylate kinase
LRCAAPADSAAYIALFYALNDAAVPAHHQHWKQALAGTAAPMTNLQLLPLFDNHHAVGACWYELKQRPENRGLRGTWQQLEYAWDVCASFFRWDGKVVTVSGVDGAGKSTILQDVRLQVEKTMRREVVLLRHRPSLLPILSAWRHGRQAAEQQAAQRLPRQGNNQSMAASLLRFAYYYTDYLLGQWYVFFKYVVRGKVVLYDRYYFDFMADPRRSNLVLPTWLTRAAFAGLLRPDFNFFLYAPAADILRRKAELSEADIQWLTGQYLDVFERLQSQDAGTVYLPIENTDRAKTGRIIFAYLSNALRA